jgi:hypothetical protein
VESGERISVWPLSRFGPEPWRELRDRVATMLRRTRVLIQSGFNQPFRFTVRVTRSGPGSESLVIAATGYSAENCSVGARICSHLDTEWLVGTVTPHLRYNFATGNAVDSFCLILAQCATATSIGAALTLSRHF